MSLRLVCVSFHLMNLIEVWYAYARNWRNMHKNRTDFQENMLNCFTHPVWRI